MRRTNRTSSPPRIAIPKSETGFRKVVGTCDGRPAGATVGVLTGNGPGDRLGALSSGELRGRVDRGKERQVSCMTLLYYSSQLRSM